MDYYTDKSDIITTTRTTEATTEFSTTSTSTSTLSSTAATEILTITTEFVMPTLDGSEFSTEKSPETKTEFVTEAPKIPAKWTDWVSSYIPLKMLEYNT